MASEEPPATGTRPGSLIVVGTGIEAIGQVTLAAEGAIRTADVVIYSVSDLITAEWILSVNPAAKSLYPLYTPGGDRYTTYLQMVEQILAEVHGGRRVCAVFYGHPGIAVTSSHLAIKQARAEGYPARMLPGISALDCLISDLGIDPADAGFQSYDATGLIRQPERINPHCPLVVWQVAVTAEPTYTPGSYNREGYLALVDSLTAIYGPEHNVTLYEAAFWTVCDARIETILIPQLANVEPTIGSTLYVPAKKLPKSGHPEPDHGTGLQHTRQGATK
jgi:precorrin-6B methylase 1